jgi:hypothetical protein
MTFFKVEFFKEISVSLFYVTYIVCLFLPLFEHLWASVESPMVYAVNKLTGSDHLYGSGRIMTLYLSGSSVPPSSEVRMATVLV